MRGIYFQFKSKKYSNNMSSPNQKRKKLKIKYKTVPASPEEIQRRIDNAFDILFDAVFNKKKDD